MAATTLIVCVWISSTHWVVSPEPSGSVATPVVFMETADTEAGDALPTFQRVTDPGRINTYRQWMENDAARLAMELYDLAWATVQRRSQNVEAPPPYHIALVPGGNHADGGFRLRDVHGTKEFTTTPYIKLGPDRYRFGNTFLHETGHVVLATLNRGEGVLARGIASIPHTTAALTDRGTAFNEGFAIHLETIDAHLNRDPEVRKRYHHERYAFGSDNVRQSEYFQHAADLATFAQTTARYWEVRENNFAFASACRKPDYLRVQLEKARDFSTVRSANQLLQSEGFYASFFFAWTFRGETIPTKTVLRQRQEKMMATLAEMFAAYPPAPDAPHLLHYVETYMRLYPSEATEMVNVLMDLSHGVFVDAAAQALWHEFYDAALRLDIEGLPKDKINKKRAEWRAAVLKDPKTIYRRLGPQLPCEVASVTVKLVAFGQDIPLGFDLNTVQPGIIRLVPGITGDHVLQWVTTREQEPFAGVDDFKKRVPLDAATLSAIKFNPPKD